MKPSNKGKREKLPRRGVQVEEEEYEGDGFEDENNHDSVVSDRSYGGDLEKLGIGKIIIWEVLI